jgi:N-acetylmuramoyl-L-alanine amidase-like protein
VPRAAVIAVFVLAIAGCGGGSGSASRPQHEATLGNEAPPPPAHTTATATRPAHAPKPAAAARPPIKQLLIPFGEKRKQETAAYAQRHYGVSTTRVDPKVIVEHYSVTPTAQGVHDLFALDTPDVELHELPQVCSHFVVDRDGTIYQLVRLSLICRHTVGLNNVAFGIEHVGNSDADILGNPPQLNASLRLTAWLRCRYGIALENVIGHNESLSSPYHHELVTALQNQTHDDWKHADMERYRHLLAKRTCA